VKALTIYQPHASLIIAGVKCFETRPRPMNYRGTLAIHAGLMPFDRVFNSWGHVTEAVRVEHLCMDLLQTDNLRDLLKGVVLGTVEVVGCWPIVSREFPDAGKPFVDYGGCRAPVSKTESALGDFTPGRYAIQLSNPVAFPEPIPARGQQGMWRWEPSSDCIARRPLDSNGGCQHYVDCTQEYAEGCGAYLPEATA